MPTIGGNGKGSKGRDQAAELPQIASRELNTLIPPPEHRETGVGQ